MRNQAKTHVLAHTHEYGTTRYLFVPPAGFEVPYGSFFGNSESDGTDYPELMALIAFLEVDYEPEKSETIDILVCEDTIAEPTLRELQKLMIQEAAISA